jgi:hypothetical protein
LARAHYQGQSSALYANNTAYGNDRTLRTKTGIFQSCLETQAHPKTALHTHCRAHNEILIPRR